MRRRALHTLERKGNRVDSLGGSKKSGGRMNLVRFLIAAFMAFGVWTTAVAQGRPDSPTSGGGIKVVTGQVAYSDPDAPGPNTQVDALNALEGWGSSLQTIVTGSGEGKAPELNQNTVSYLSVLYLYCSAKRGPCPFILETILDADIARSRSESGAQCSLMKRFFKSYLSQSLDERAKFIFSLTQGLEMAKFNTNVRPRFVECKETVSAMLADKEVLTQRFGPHGSAAETVAEFRTFVSQIKDGKVDIFVATGVSPR